MLDKCIQTTTDFPVGETAMADVAECCDREIQADIIRALEGKLSAEFQVSAKIFV